MTTGDIKCRATVFYSNINSLYATNSSTHLSFEEILVPPFVFFLPSASVLWFLLAAAGVTSGVANSLSSSKLSVSSRKLVALCSVCGFFMNVFITYSMRSDQS